MVLVADRQLQHIGETRGCEDHDHDLIHELSERLDSLWRYDQYIANADGHPDLQNFWRDIKQQEQGNVKRIKQLIGDEIGNGCF